MKILVYSDVHGNKYALNKLQESQDYKSADLRVFCGDAVALGPYANECLSSIWQSGDVFLLGNHDIYCAHGLPEEEYPYFAGDKKAHQAYIRNKTLDEYKEKLTKMPKEYYFNIAGKTFYFTHFAWETEKLVIDDPDAPNSATEKTAQIFKNIKADYIIFGHNHKPSEFEYDNKHFVCVGSLGMKFPGNYLVIEIDNEKVNLDKKQICYEVERLKDEMIKENYPRAEKYTKFFDDNI